MATTALSQAYPLGTAINETIDASVWQRWRADASYRSPALVRALADARMTVPPVIVGD